MKGRGEAMDILVVVFWVVVSAQYAWHKRQANKDREELAWLRVSHAQLLQRNHELCEALAKQPASELTCRQQQIEALPWSVLERMHSLVFTVAGCESDDMCGGCRRDALSIRAAINGPEIEAVYHQREETDIADCSVCENRLVIQAGEHGPYLCAFCNQDMRSDDPFFDCGFCSAGVAGSPCAGDPLPF
jgi:hypothetical protein